MPLKKSASKLAFKQNVKAEIDSGRPIKQSVAIAYAEKRAAQKKMSAGGMVKKPMKVNRMGRR